MVTLPDGHIVVTEHLDNGRVFKCTFNSVALAEGFIKHRKQFLKYGRDETLRMWNREEARERKKLGLKVKKDYSVSTFRHFREGSMRG